MSLDRQTRPQTNGLPGRRARLPGFQKRQSHKSSQDPYMLNKDDKFLDDDNNMRKDADVNLDQQ